VTTTTILKLKLIPMVASIIEPFTKKFLKLFSTASVGTDITDDIQMITNNKGSTVMFYNGFKYLKSGESKTSLQYRCVHYMKKCRSRIIFNRENETAMKNEIAHNHAADPNAYDNFVISAIMTREFGRNKRPLRSKLKQAVDDDTEN
jgi:hypothetical protein